MKEKVGGGWQGRCRLGKISELNSLALNSLPLGARMPYTVLVQQGHLSHGKFMSCFKGNRGGLQCPSPAAPEVLFIPSNQYAKVAYLGTAYSESLQSVAGNKWRSWSSTRILGNLNDIQLGKIFLHPN